MGESDYVEYLNSTNAEFFTNEFKALMFNIYY